MTKKLIIPTLVAIPKNFDEILLITEDDKVINMFIPMIKKILGKIPESPKIQVIRPNELKNMMLI